MEDNYIYLHFDTLSYKFENLFVCSLWQKISQMIIDSLK